MPKKAIIIGATSGLGNQVARQLAAQGWQLGLAGRRIERLETLQQEFGASQIAIQMIDVTSDDATLGLDRLITQVGLPDLFFYVSGVGYQNCELDINREIMTVRTNCEGMVRLVDHFVNLVRQHPETYSAKNKAHVAAITSIAGTKGLGCAPAYSATKKMQSVYLTALAQLSRMEHIPVRFTDIRPGFIQTEILNPDKHYPLMMQPQQAAHLIVKALARKRRIYTFDWRFRLIVGFWRLIPRCIWERLTFVSN